MMSPSDPCDELWVRHVASQTIVGGENLNPNFTEAAHAELPWLVRRAIEAQTVGIQTDGRKVQDPELVERCWATITAWPAKALLSYHDSVGGGFIGEASSALRRAAVSVGQLPHEPRSARMHVTNPYLHPLAPRRRAMTTAENPNDPSWPAPTAEELAAEPARRPAVLRAMGRRRFLQRAGAGATVLAFGGVYAIAEDGWLARARAQTRADGRPRLPPGQQVITKLKPMGGEPGDTSKSKYRLRVHGEVATELDLDFRALLKIKQVTRAEDVHCVTGWTRFDAQWTGVQLTTLARLAGVTERARFVIFEAAHGYTANVPIANALAENVMVAHKLDGAPLAKEHGAPVRAVVPDLYFWKSAKWLTGIRFVRRDESGYWERRGYNDRGDPWTEERYS